MLIPVGFLATCLSGMAIQVSLERRLARMTRRVRSVIGTAGVSAVPAAPYGVPRQAELSRSGPQGKLACVALCVYPGPVWDGVGGLDLRALLGHSLRDRAARWRAREQGQARRQNPRRLR